MLVAVLLVSVAGIATELRLTAPLLLVAALVFALSGIFAVSQVSPRLSPADENVLFVLAAALVAAGLFFTGGPLVTLVSDGGTPGWLAAFALYIALGMAAVATTSTRGGAWLFYLFLAVHALLAFLYLLEHGVVVDVEVFLREGSELLLNGSNPYAATYTNPYSAADSEEYFGPGVIVDGRIGYGFPYLPVPLLASVPGLLLGDVRLTGMACMLLLAIVVRHVSTDRVGKTLSLTAVAGISSLEVLWSGWTEPVGMAALGLLVLAMTRRRILATGVWLGVFLATKQYVAVVLPLLWAFHRWGGRRTAATAIGVATALVLPFFLADPIAFWRSVVGLHLVQPYRPDSTSLLVAIVEAAGWPPPSAFGLLPLAAGTVFALFLALRAPRAAATLVAAVGVSLLATVLLSKQAFVNYYVMVAAALVLAVAAWPVREPERPSARQP